MWPHYQSLCEHMFHCIPTAKRVIKKQFKCFTFKKKDRIVCNENSSYKLVYMRYPSLGHYCTYWPPITKALEQYKYSDSRCNLTISAFSTRDNSDEKEEKDLWIIIWSMTIKLEQCLSITKGVQGLGGLCRI